MNEAALLDRLAGALKGMVPGLHCRPRRGLILRGGLGVPGYRLCLASRGRFGALVCRGFTAVDPRLLVDMSSGMCGPARLERRRASGRPRLVASWPWQLPADHLARLLAADLRWVLGREPGPPSRPPVSPSLRQRLKDVVAAETRLTELPSAGEGWDFVAGRGASAMQLRARQPNRHAVALSTLVANWRAMDPVTQRAASTVILMLNGRLRWVRLTLRGTAVEAEITLPVAAVSQEAWKLARHALDQAVRSCRQTLRLIQAPEVAAAFERIHPTGAPAERPGLAERLAAVAQVVDEKAVRSKAVEMA